MRFAIALLLAIVMMFCSGCWPALLVPAAAAGSVAADHHICKKKGITPPQVNENLKGMFKKK